jgi:uncharacterized repeat protein (TIGR03803 family)
MEMYLRSASTVGSPIWFLSNDTNGGAPLAGLARSTNGNFYGTTSGGGDFSAGTLFAVDPDGHPEHASHVFGWYRRSFACNATCLRDSTAVCTAPLKTAAVPDWKSLPDHARGDAHHSSFVLCGEDGTSPAGALVEGSAGTF